MTSQLLFIPLYNIFETSNDRVQSLKLGACASVQGFVAFDEVELGVLQLLEQIRADVVASSGLLNKPGRTP